MKRPKYWVYFVSLGLMITIGLIFYISKDQVIMASSVASVVNSAMLIYLLTNELQEKDKFSSIDREFLKIKLALTSYSRVERKRILEID